MMKRRPAAFAAAPEMPISALNTTPLIDVMLVLLIMFIVTIPAMTHSVKIDAPSGPAVQEEPEIRRLDIDAAGRFAWDGMPIAEAELPARLAAFRQARPEGVLRFRAEAETRYEDFDRILAIVKRAGIPRLGLVGNEGHLSAIER